MLSRLHNCPGGQTYLFFSSHVSSIHDSARYTKCQILCYRVRDNLQNSTLSSSIRNTVSSDSGNMDAFAKLELNSVSGSTSVDVLGPLSDQDDHDVEPLDANFGST